jgi:hypothetical protein
MQEAAMPRTYSTFEIVKIVPKLNRNTLQSALAAGFVVPDIHRADGPGERSAFSLDGVYNVALFFRLVHVGLKRKKAAELIRMLDMTWENVGVEPGKYKYLEIAITDQGGSNLMSGGGEKLVERTTQPDANEIFRWTISLLQIKDQVDAGVGRL